MGKLKELAIEVEMLLAQGYSVETIAELLDVPVDVIETIALELE
jgi:hypothetical protein